MRRYILKNTTSAIVLTVLSAFLAHTIYPEAMHISAIASGIYVVACLSLVVSYYSGIYKTIKPEMKCKFKRYSHFIIVLPTAIELALVHEYLSNSTLAFSLVATVNGLILLFLEAKEMGDNTSN